MSNTLQWVYNHVDPDFITTIILVIGIVVFLHAVVCHGKANEKRPNIIVVFLRAVVCHGKANEKRPNMVLGIGLIVFAAWNVQNTLWHNMYATFEPRSGFNKVVTIGSDLYMVEDDDLNRLVLTKVDLYNDSFAQKFKDTYGDSGRADDILMVNPRPKDVSLDCATPSKITSK